MAFEKINGTLRHTRLQNESDEYVAKREQLRLAVVARLDYGVEVPAAGR